MATFESVWLPRILRMLSGPAALKALRSCRSLQKSLWPQCLQAGDGFWILEQLETVSLEKLLERDADLCNCFLWARSDMKNHKISYTSFDGVVEIHTCMPTESKKADSDSEESKPQLVVRRLSDTFKAMNGNESLELTRRRLAFPRTMSQKLPELFAGSLKVVGEESPALMAMGLCGWEVSKTSEPSPGDIRWLRFCFHRPRPKVPLAILHLSGEFDLPGGDGRGEVCLGYLSTDLDYVVSMRDFSEYPGYRHLASKVCTTWEEGRGLLHTWGPQPVGSLSDEGTKMEEILANITTPDGWEVERTTMYMDEQRCMMGSPFFKAIYQDAKQLLESCARDST